MPKKCQHALLSLTRSGQNISAYCTTCWVRITRSAELTIWRYGLSGSHRKCQGKIVRITRSGKEVSAECLACGETIAKVRAEDTETIDLESEGRS